MQRIFVTEDYRGFDHGRILLSFVESLIKRKNEFPDIGLLIDHLTLERAYEKRDDGITNEFDYKAVGMFQRSGWRGIAFGTNKLIYNPNNLTVHGNIISEIQRRVRPT